MEKFVFGTQRVNSLKSDSRPQIWMNRAFHFIHLIFVFTQSCNCLSVNKILASALDIIRTLMSFEKKISSKISNQHFVDAMPLPDVEAH